MSFSLFIANIENDCTLGIDFLKLTNVESHLYSILGIGRREFSGACVESEIQVPGFLKELFERDSEKLSLEQKRSLLNY